MEPIELMVEPIEPWLAWWPWVTEEWRPGVLMSRPGAVSGRGRADTRHTEAASHSRGAGCCNNGEDTELLCYTVSGQNGTSGITVARKGLNRFLMKGLIGAFNKDKVLVGVFSGHCYCDVLLTALLNSHLHDVILSSTLDD